MSCPDVDRLTEYLTSGSMTDVELEAHLEDCESCQEELFLIRELTGSLSPEIEVPEYLVQRTLMTFAEPERAPEKSRTPVPHLVTTGALGFLTAFLAILISGSAGASGPSLPLVSSLLVGLGAVVFSGADRQGAKRHRDERNMSIGASTAR